MKIKNLLKTLFFEEGWDCAYRFKDGSKTILDFDKHEHFKLMSIDKHFWAADPFLFEKDGRVFVFFEYKNIKKGKAVLAVSELYEGGGNSEPTVIYEFKGHTSYPCIFEFDKEIYIIPETIQEQKLQLLKCVEWPFKWEHCAVLLTNFACVDCTFFEYNSKPFLFIYEVLNGTNRLYIAGLNFIDYSLENCFLAKEYSGSLGRPAGKNLNTNLRIVQPGDKFYGEKIEVYSFNTDFKKHYCEDKIFEVDASFIDIDSHKKYIGIHTYNNCHSCEVIDLLRKPKFNLFKPIVFLLKLLGLFGFGFCEKRNQIIYQNKE